jgi:hypothetical protein
METPRHPHDESGPDLERLEAEAQYHRERLALYRARVYGGKLTSETRLRELQRTSEAADARLRAAGGPRPRGR